MAGQPRQPQKDRGSHRRVASSSIRCIYCKQLKPRPRRGEHIVLDGLGGRATIQDVCADCNQRLGDELDREFPRNTFIAIHRLLDPSHTRGEGPGPQFVEIDRGFLDARLLNTRKLIIPAQAALVEGVLLIVGSEKDLRVDLRKADERFRREAERAKILVRDIGEHEPVRLIINAPGRPGLIRARTEQQAALLIAACRSASTPVRAWAPNMRLAGVKLSTDFNVFGRCAAKMAFNMGAAVFGPEHMLRDSFDPIRRYILGDDVVSGPAVSAEGEAGVKIDYRYVEPWFGTRTERRRLGPRNGHRIVLTADQGFLRGQVTLWGGLEDFHVRLGPCPGSWQSPGKIAALWSRPTDDWWVMGGRHGPQRHGSCRLPLVGHSWGGNAV